MTTTWTLLLVHSEKCEVCTTLLRELPAISDKIRAIATPRPLSTILVDIDALVPTCEPLRRGLGTFTPQLALLGPTATELYVQNAPDVVLAPDFFVFNARVDRKAVRVERLPKTTPALPYTAQNIISWANMELTSKSSSRIENDGATMGVATSALGEHAQALAGKLPLTELPHAPQMTSPQRVPTMAGSSAATAARPMIAAGPPRTTGTSIANLPKRDLDALNAWRARLFAVCVDAPQTNPTSGLDGKM